MLNISFKNTVIFALIVIALGCAVGIYQSRAAADKANSALTQFKADSKVRRDQSCTFSERQYQSKVENLSSTYKYLISLPRDEARTTLNQFIIKNIPKSIQDAQISVPPKYCEEPGIGLPGKFPPIPPAPDFSYLVTIQSSTVAH